MNIVELVELVEKYNQNHDARGRFSSGSSGGSSLGSTPNPLRERLNQVARQHGIENPENYGSTELLEAVEAAQRQPKPLPVKPVKPRASRTRPAPGELPFPKKAGGAYGSADLKAINPNFNQGPEYQTNCTRCVTAIELRHRGYDVTANPKDGRGGGRTRDLLAKWKSSDGTLAGGPEDGAPARAPAPGETLGMSHGSRILHNLPAGSGAENKRKLDSAVKKWGKGSRGFVVVAWERRIDGSHVFNVENRDGKVVYTDGQTNSDNATGHFSRVDTTREGSVAVARVDDLIPTEGVEDWVHAA